MTRTERVTRFSSRAGGEGTLTTENGKMTHHEAMEHMKGVGERVRTAVALERPATCSACGERIEALRVAVEGQHLACWMRANPLTV